MLTLVGMGSPNVAKVLLMLEETGLPYRLDRCDVYRGEHRNSAFEALNPNGKVPVLIDEDGTALAESGAILIFLAERSGLFLAPAGAPRYAALQWLMWQMAAIGPIFGHGIHLTSFARDEAYAVRRFTKELRRLAGVLDQRLAARPFLAGPDYSIADIATYPWILTAARFFPDVIPSPAMTGWMEAIAARPAAIRTKAIVDELAALDRASFKVATANQLDLYFGR